MEAKSGDTAGNHYLKGKVPSGPGRTWPPRLQSNGQSAPPWVHRDGPRGNLSPVPALQHLLVKGLCHQNTGRWTRGSAPPAMASAQAAAAARSCCWRGVPRSALGHQVPQRLDPAQAAQNATAPPTTRSTPPRKPACSWAVPGAPSPYQTGQFSSGAGLVKVSMPLRSYSEPCAGSRGTRPTGPGAGQLSPRMSHVPCRHRVVCGALT